jgi:hypothetical protein
VIGSASVHSFAAMHARTTRRSAGAAGQPAPLGRACAELPADDRQWRLGWSLFSPSDG